MPRSDVTALRDRIVLAALCVPLSAAVFAGCARGEEGTVPDETVSEPTTEAVTTEGTDDTEGSGGGVVEGSGDAVAVEGSGDAVELNLDPLPKPEDEVMPYPIGVRPMEGRPLMSSDEALVAPIAERSDWRRSIAAPDRLPLALRAELAEAWATDAGYEHASIASFARATMELMALGAPPDLIRRTQQAALDEVDHAEAAYGLATMVGGSPVGPGPLPLPEPREVTAAGMARAVFEEGCLGETIATLVATRQRAHAVVPEVIDALTEVVSDEAEHAALAWDTLDWLLTEAPEAVYDLRDIALERQRHFQAASRRPRTVSDDHHAWGRLSDQEVARAADEAIAHIVLPLLDALIVAHG